MKKNKLTLTEIQTIGLEIMGDIHSFCIENGIRYSLTYGSLIGAIRHKGFIPWDDDIDIMMPRPDFDVFSKSYRSKKGYILSSVYSDDTYMNYTRVYDTSTIVISPAKPSKHKVGVWIDVYPIDAIPDEVSAQVDQFQRLRRYTGLVMRWRRALYKISCGNVFQRLRSCIVLLSLRLKNNGESFPYWHNRIISICKENVFGTTKRCSSLVCFDANKKNRQEVFLTSDFENYRLIDFEDKTFYIVSEYDHILRTIFGDYMQLPPVEERVSHVINSWGFYWK